MAGWLVDLSQAIGNAIGPENLVLAHAGFGAIAGIFAIWLFGELFHAREEHRGRIQYLSLLMGIFTWLAYIFGGLFYMPFYDPDKAAIKAGSWDFGHNIFMESKEHIFFMALLLVTFVVIIVYTTDFTADAGTKKVLLWTVGTIIVLGFLVETFGAIISFSYRVALEEGAATILLPWL